MYKQEFDAITIKIVCQCSQRNYKNYQYIAKNKNIFLCNCSIVTMKKLNINSTLDHPSKGIIRKSGWSNIRASPCGFFAPDP